MEPSENTSLALLETVDIEGDLSRAMDQEPAKLFAVLIRNPVPYPWEGVMARDEWLMRHGETYLAMRRHIPETLRMLKEKLSPAERETVKSHLLDLIEGFKSSAEATEDWERKLAFYMKHLGEYPPPAWDYAIGKLVAEGATFFPSVGELMVLLEDWMCDRRAIISRLRRLQKYLGNMTAIDIRKISTDSYPTTPEEKALAAEWLRKAIDNVKQASQMP